MPATFASAAKSIERIRATPYARRLARERGLALRSITGSGPDGRIVADDLVSLPDRPSRPSADRPADAAKPLPAISTGIPSAIATHVDLSALDALLARIAELRPGITPQHACLKAASTALSILGSGFIDDTVLLIASGQRKRLAGIAAASIGSVATILERANHEGAAHVAVSFFGGAGIRPVAAQLIEGIPMRLIVGSPEKDGGVYCLLSYDAGATSDDEAETYLAAFRDLVEAPFRLLV